MARSHRAGFPWIAFLASFALLALVACTTTKHVEGFTPPQETHRVVIIQPDTTVGTLQAGGGFEPRADWTETARQNITTSLKTRLAARGKGSALITTSEGEKIDPAMVEALNAEHRKLGTTIQQKWKTGPLYKKSSTAPVFKLSEGALSPEVRNAFDYAVLIYARDSTSTGGRKAVIGAATAGCVLLDILFPNPLCMPPSGGYQSAFLSLVEMKSGQVVWHNALHDPFGDLRDAKGADEMVKALLGDL